MSVIIRETYGSNTSHYPRERTQRFLLFAMAILARATHVTCASVVSAPGIDSRSPLRVYAVVPSSVSFSFIL